MGKINQRQREVGGFSLTEVAIVLCIIGMVLASLWVYMSAMNNNVKHEKFTHMLKTLTENIRGVYAGKTSFTNLHPEFLVQKEVFPSDMIRMNGDFVVPVSPFGEFTSEKDYRSVYICGWKARGSTECSLDSTDEEFPLFAIETILPRDACITAALRNSDVGSFPGLVSVYINKHQLELPLTLAAVTPECNKPLNYVDFVYKLIP